MRLRSVTVKNFRALANVTVELDNITVLIGENNSGKTSFLEALRLCLGQGAFRRGDVFDDYDHHLPSDQAQVGDAGDTEIILRFGETEVGEWPAEVLQAITEVIAIEGDYNQVNLRIKSTKDSKTGEMASAWEFLDQVGNTLRPKRAVSFILRDLQQLKPFFYLPAFRDAAREFQPRSQFWGPFLRNPTIPADVRQELEQQLDALNAKVIGADDKLKGVKECLSKAGRIVSLGESNVVSIDAVPGKARDLLSRAQVSITGRSGARLPMARHGAGTQSLSVLFLFESFLSSMLESIYGPGAVPMLAVEEPETHLHPSAVRALWSSLCEMPGQKIVATHSGDLLAKVPLASIRRFCDDGSGVTVRKLGGSTLGPDDARKLALHVRATRGELLFARCWLLVEGATEVWLFEGIAEALGIDLERMGVRIVQYAQVMPDPFIRLADDLGIHWLVFSDGDPGGQDKTRGVAGLLRSRDRAKHFQMLAEPNVEVHLCKAGFGAIYLSQVPQQNRAKITATPEAEGYWEQVVRATPGRGKEARAIKVVEEIASRGPQSVPPALQRVLETAIQLSGGDRDR